MLLQRLFQTVCGGRILRCSALPVPGFEIKMAQLPFGLLIQKGCPAQTVQAGFGWDPGHTVLDLPIQISAISPPDAGVGAEEKGGPAPAGPARDRLGLRLVWLSQRGWSCFICLEQPAEQPYLSFYRLSCIAEHRVLSFYRLSCIAEHRVCPHLDGLLRGHFRDHRIDRIWMAAAQKEDAAYEQPGLEGFSAPLLSGNWLWPGSGFQNSNCSWSFERSANP